MDHAHFGCMKILTAIVVQQCVITTWASPSASNKYACHLWSENKSNQKPIFEVSLSVFLHFYWATIPYKIAGIIFCLSVLIDKSIHSKVILPIPASDEHQMLVSAVGHISAAQRPTKRHRSKLRMRTNHALHGEWLLMLLQILDTSIFLALDFADMFGYHI